MTRTIRSTFCHPWTANICQKLQPILTVQSTDAVHNHSQRPSRCIGCYAVTEKPRLTSGLTKTRHVKC